MEFNEYAKTRPALIIKAALDLIHSDGEVYEVRIPKSKAGTISGYFNDSAKAAALIAKENGKHQGIYSTVNPVNPQLLARNENKFEFGSFTTSADADIIRRRWFLVDLDPIRPAGISSSNSELLECRRLADEVVEWLTSIGWPQPLIADSGNGVHIMYRVDEPNDDAARVDFEFATKMLSSIWSTAKVAVDTTSFNASRVWKIYGTVSAKGSSTDERPHRVAMITSAPKEFTLVTREQIDNVARPLRDAKSDEFRDMTGEFIGDMVKWLADRGQTVTSGPRPMFGNEGQKWTISRCPFNPEHQNPMVGLVNNRPVFRCLHNSCSAFRWKEYREKIDPTYKDPETVKARLIEWAMGDTETPDNDLMQAACATQSKLGGIMKAVKKEVPRERLLVLEDAIKKEKRRYIKETLGDNGEKGNIVGLINRTKTYQQEGIVPMYWIADYDHRIRAGTVGDIDCPKVTDEDEISLMVKFHSAGDSWVKQTHTSQIIKHLAAEYRVNPLKVFLKRKTWDGVNRLTEWLPTYMGTENNEYTRAVGRKWFISAVARAMEPGCQVDHMLIFEGSQGIGKSQALRVIGGQFYTEYSGGVKAGVGGQKDMVAVIVGKLIVEMSELATIRRTDIESLKAMLTCTADDVRLAYERDARTYPRTCVFAGTTNETKQGYIADQSGARRFWPVLCGEVHPVMSQRLKVDVDQLWAEAVEAYEGGEDWWTVPTELVLNEQADRQILLEDSEPWFAKIRGALTDGDNYAEVFIAVPEFISGQPTGDFRVRVNTIGGILGVLLGIDTSRQTTIDVARVQKVLKAIGFKKMRPSQKWNGGTYAYELSRDAIPHLWSAIDAARQSVKFPKEFHREDHS